MRRRPSIADKRWGGAGWPQVSHAWFRRLKPIYDKLLSNVASNFNLRRYEEALILSGEDKYLNQMKLEQKRAENVLAKEKVGPGGHCLPRHPPHMPAFLEFIGIT